MGFLCVGKVLLFYKPKPAYEMRISDWSSDVCSSDLARRPTSAKPGACVPASLRPDSPAWPVGLRGKIKEEAAAAGGCRGTFAPKACRSRRARQVATRHALGQEAGNPPRSWVKKDRKSTRLNSSH